MATVVTPAAQRHVDRLDRIWSERPGFLGWLTTTDHKRIGILYFFTSLAFFGAGGIEAVLMRTQLIGPNGHVLSPAAYDEMFTMHGITMIFLFVIPMTTGAFGNYLVPLMIGARDMAFPRMNAVSYWIFLCSGIFIYIGLVSCHAPNAGWFGSKLPPPKTTTAEHAGKIVIVAKVNRSVSVVVLELRVNN